jgi:hypothetical protein
MYKDEIRDALLQTLQAFFQIEQGNRITINNFTTLINNIIKAFEENRCHPSTSTSTDSETP